MQLRFVSLILFLFSTTVFCQIPDHALKSMQDDANEKLFVTIIETVYDTTIMSDGDSVVECTVQALVDSVFQSKTGLVVGDTATVVYHLYDHWGQISSPYVAVDAYVPAFLNWDTSGGCFNVAAHNGSFHYISLSDNKEKSPIVNDSLWTVFRKSKLKDSAVIGYYSLKTDRNNLLFYHGDTLVLRCYSFYNNLYPSKHMEHSLQPTFGTCRQDGTILTFAIEGEEDDSLMLILPDEKSAELDKRMKLYSKDIEILNSGHDYVSKRSLIWLWGEDSFRTALIHYGENKVVIKEGYGLTFFMDSVSKKITLQKISENESTTFLDSLVYIKNRSGRTSPLIGNLDMKLDSISDSLMYTYIRQFGPGMPILNWLTFRVGDTLRINDPVTNDTLVFTALESFIDTNTISSYNSEYVFFKKIRFDKEVNVISPVKKTLSLSKVKDNMALISINGRVVYTGYHSLAEITSVVSSIPLASGVYFIAQNLQNGKYLGKIRVE